MFISELTDQPYDFAIIGAGPAGISLALSLAEKEKYRILLIDSGGLANNEAIHQLSSVEATGDLAENYYPFHAQRVFGGGSSVWMGYCGTLEKRAFINGEWPIDYEEINKYYPGAAKILELSDEVLSTPRSLKRESNLVYKPYHLSPPVRFNQKYQQIIRDHPTIDMLLNNTCLSVTEKKGIIDGLQIINSSEKDAAVQHVYARHYILACGGVGNPRLLRLSGIAANSPVGEYFTEHPHIYNAGTVMLDKEVIDAVIMNGNVVHALQLSDQYCIENQLLNYAVSFETTHFQDRFITGNKKTIYYSKVTIRSEMMTDRSNCVGLGESLDKFGNPIASIKFHFNYQDMAKKSWDHFAKELLVSGVGRASVTPDFYPEITGGGHYMKTTRMGHSSTNSVVDGNCKVHGVDNLYVAGSSVFAASGAANPTLTIVALALRLADHLSNKL